MGCDIHMCIEMEMWSDSAWEAAMLEHACYDVRNYVLFSWLAGVRNAEAVTPLAEPRGLPADASAPVKACFEQWSSDCHSHSWLLASEILGAVNPPVGVGHFVEWLRRLTSPDEQGGWATVMQNMKPERIRLVFAFDN